jgi:hypothetical protein
MQSRGYAAVRRWKKQREEERIVRESERAARVAALMLGLCPDCGEPTLGTFDHTGNCEEVA